MEQGKKILELIENVDPKDTDALDEIDMEMHKLLYSWSGIRGKRPHIKYTRSRDALKEVRPEGFEFPKDVLTNVAGFIFGYGCPAFNNGKFLAYYKPLPTEELAELHAIIQAIMWERDNNKHIDNGTHSQ
tara:strand:+ start:36 stop:425 length:390 start_codon:yes stop_codon:yes gene_type:complete